MPTNNYSVFFIATTRHYNEANKEFLDYDFDTTNTIHYFKAYYKSDVWIISPYSNLETLLDSQEQFKNLIVFTEGLGKTFTRALDRATMLKKIYNEEVILFDWPTSRPYLKRLKNVRATYRLASKASKAYGQFLTELQTYKNNHITKFNHVTIINHSMGNLVLMHGVKQNYFSALTPNFADNIVLNAACVNKRKHKQWVSKLNFTNNIYITINNHDTHLRIARIVFGAKQLGVARRLEKSTNARYVDFSGVLKEEHNYFLTKSVLNEKPYLQLFYQNIFDGKQPQLIFGY